MAIATIVLVGCKDSEPNMPDNPFGDYVVYGAIYTAEQAPDGRYPLAEALVVKGDKFIYVGSKAGAQPYISRETKIMDYTNHGMIMPTCTNGHAHYMLGYALGTFGAVISDQTDVTTFMQVDVPKAVAAAREHNYPTILGNGWNYFIFKEAMPTRQQLDLICNDIPMLFADNEGHKALVNTIALVKAGIMDAEGHVLKRGKDIRGGEIVMGADDTPSGLLLEQAGTFVREALDFESIYTAEMAKSNILQMQKDLWAKGYTIYMDGWSTYFFNENFYQAAQQLDQNHDLKLILGLSYEIESWMNIDTALTKANNARKYTTQHVRPQWVKLFIDGTVEGGTGYSQIPYPDGHQGLVNWSKKEVTTITKMANDAKLSMHVHTMGDSAVALAVDAFVDGGQDDKRNTIVHVRNIMPSTLQKMAAHQLYATSGMLWHHLHYMAPTFLWLLGIVPEGYESKSYPMKAFFDYGINLTSHSDYPALSGSPDDPFGIMEIALTGVQDAKTEYTWWQEELLTREQALQALTLNGAKQVFMEQERGSIRKDKYADFLVVDQNLLTCPVKSIHNTKVLNTFFEGRPVYSVDGL